MDRDDDDFAGDNECDLDCLQADDDFVDNLYRMHQDAEGERYEPY